VPFQLRKVRINNLIILLASGREREPSLVREPNQICVSPEMIYYWISAELSALYFGLDVSCQFEARVGEFDVVYTSTAVPVFPEGEVVCEVPASNIQNTSSPEYQRRHIFAELKMNNLLIRLRLASALEQTSFLQIVNN
jgi:hypothetical protein